ncbi:MAG: SDR family oxidoreductase [Gammaproteobacteria bacterium]|nr:SDR family oxidoreductase [Gammaproteobacteria bacterium]
MTLTGQCAIITGANQGFGFEIAKQFIQSGARVMLCARDLQKLTAARNELLSFAKGPEHIAIQAVDIAQPKQVEKLVADTIKQFGKIDILVANAGVYGTKGPIEEIDWDEWSEAIDINLKGTVFMCRAVVPHMKKHQSGKIIFISGGGATKPMANFSAYAASKAGVVRFAETLADELKAFHIDVNSVAPGALNTRLLDEVLAAGPEKVGETFYQQSLKQKSMGGTDLSVGANLCVFLASPESNGITGRLISAVWDPWKKLPDYLDELKNSDIYTLRRIVPKDRGKAWDEIE